MTKAISEMMDELDRLRAERDRLRGMLSDYLSAQPQCDCGEHSGCGMGAVRAKAKRLLGLQTTDAPLNHE
jgi:hypothetical protein